MRYIRARIGGEDGGKKGRKARKTTRRERRSLEGVTAATPQLGPPDGLRL